MKPFGFLVVALVAVGACKYYEILGDPKAPPTTSGAARDSAAGGGASESGTDYALDFSVGSAVTVPDDPALALTRTWTVEAWISPRNPAAWFRGHIVSRWGDSSHAAFALVVENGVLSLELHDGRNPTQFLYGQPLRDGVWQHVAATFANGTAVLYQDGAAVLTASGVVTPAACCPRHGLAIGREEPEANWWNGWQFFGAIDEVRIWNVARTPEEIAATMHTAPPSAAPGLVGRWSMNDGSGTIAHDAMGKHDGIVSYAAWIAPGVP